MRSLVVLAIALACSAWSAAASPTRLNTLGYPIHGPKVATVEGQAEQAHVVDAETGQRVLDAIVRPSIPIGVSATTVIDFSDVREPGVYRLSVDGVETPAFEVADSVYNFPLYTAVRAMYLWRCGTAVSGTHDGDVFCHEACHLHDARLDEVGKPDETLDGIGGWHDAGDYNKYVVNGAFASAMMLQAWERFEDRLADLNLDLPESGNATPDFLDEVRWELEWLLKMQADDGRVYHKLSTHKFGGFILPEEESEDRYFCPWGSAATADFTAVMALATRVYRPYDREFAQQCLAASEKSYAFLLERPDDHQADQSAFKTGPYDANDRDRRPWAAVELWETTGRAEYLDAFQSEMSRRAASSPGPTDSLVPLDWDWKNVGNLGVFTYLNTQRDGRDPALVARVREDLLMTADAICSLARRHPYARPLGRRYYWGSEGTVVRTAMVLHEALRITGDARYNDAVLDGLNHVFGRNPYGRSYVTGLGHDPPRRPHSRRSEADDVEAPWPGYLIGGPNPGPNDWRDEVADYRTNEFCINWNGALIFALASQVEPTTFDAAVRERQSSDDVQ
ncbi:MAG: glycoside hydrolase family 9 protein [Planctomycetota bacterium]